MGESHYLKAAAAGLPAFPPGFIPRYEAAQMFGVALGTWEQWERSGRVRIPRHKMKSTKGGPWVLYALSDLEQLREELKKQEEERARRPEGLVTRQEAAGMFGVALKTWTEWESAGRVTITRHKWKPGVGPPFVMYAVAELARLREEFRRIEEEQSRPPPGLVNRHEAAKLFDFSVYWWDDFERLGRMPVRCVWVPSHKGPAYKMYPLDELLRFREEYRQRMQPRPDPGHPNCYRVPLSGYQRHREAIIDAESLPLVQGRGWHWEEKTDGHAGCVALATHSGSNTPLKRIIMGVADVGPEMRVSHANGDPLDCRRENLVVRTIDEQLYGKRKRGPLCQREYTSKYKGVSWNEERGKWVAQIRKGGVHRNIGRFDDEEDAAYAYDEAARELFGEHASLNFPYQNERPALAIDESKKRAA